MMEMPLGFRVLFVSNAPCSTDPQRAAELGIEIVSKVPGVGTLQAAASIEPSAIVIDGRVNFDAMIQYFHSFRMLEELKAIPLVGLIAGSKRLMSVEALEAGLDDCLNCSIDLREMAARLRTVSRRVQKRIGPDVRFADVILDLPGRKAYRRGKSVRLPHGQFQLLQFLMLHPAQVFTRRDLLQKVWGNDQLDEGTVTACIRRLRVALDDDGQLIQSARGGGYLLDDDLIRVGAAR